MIRALATGTEKGTHYIDIAFSWDDFMLCWMAGCRRSGTRFFLIGSEWRTKEGREPPVVYQRDIHATWKLRTRLELDE